MSIFRSYRRAIFQVAIGVLTLFGSAGLITLSESSPALASTAIPTCSSSQLTMSVDGGQGAYSAAGTQGVAFIFRNISKRACSLKGYPKFRLEPSSYKGKLTKIINGGGGIFASVPPRLVEVEPHASASFGLDYGDAYNQGNDPSAGPCMTQSATAWLPVEPHPYSVPFTTALKINFCFAGFQFSVTSIQRGRVPKKV